MTVTELQDLFEKHDDLFLDDPPTDLRPDLAAFVLLDTLVPGTSDIISAAEHDEIWLDVEPEALAAVAVEEDIKFLIRCGVRYDSETDSLAMFA